MDFLFDLALQAGESWSWKGHPPLRRHIEDVVWSDVFEHALVVDRATAKIAGYVSIHSVNLFHGVGYLSVYLERTMRSRGYLFEGVALLIQRMFDSTPVRKLYTESTDETFRKFSGGAAFQEEGRLVDYRMVRGRPCDLVISAVSKHSWDLEIRPILKAVLGTVE
ncbi:MAG: GNAT family N-acetyltransferase [Acidimicrobiaceae bacterium]|nr:GNAT family N-acetyltransferase [Acidimicrobiaceae bacterium]